MATTEDCKERTPLHADNFVTPQPQTTEPGASNVGRQQTGARSEEHHVSWSMLPQLNVVQSTREILSMSNAINRVAPLDIIRADKHSLVSIYHRLIGRELNPFLIGCSRDGIDLTTLEAVNHPHEILQEIMRMQLHPCDGITVILRKLTSSQVQLSKARRVLADEVEKGGEAFHIWKSYVGSDLDLFNEEEQQIALYHRNEFLNCLDELYRTVVGTLVEEANPVIDFEDIEVGLREWRLTNNFFKHSISFEEVLHKERLLFDGYNLGRAIRWDKRRELLNSIIEECNLGNILDMFRAEMHSAKEYGEWTEVSDKIFKLGRIKGVQLKQPGQQQTTTTPNASQTTDHKWNKNATRAADKPGTKRVSWTQDYGSQKNRDRYGPTIPGERFYAQKDNPKREVEDVEKRPSLSKGRCFKCNLEGHWARDCQSTPRSIHQSLRTETLSIDEPKIVEEPFSVAKRPIADRDRLKETNMPFVDVIFDSVEFNACGLLDTASNVNYVSKPLFLKLKHLLTTKIDEVRVLVETMGGTYTAENSLRITLNAAIRDSNGEISAFRLTSFLVHEGEVIPGGSDILLAADWITNLQLVISSQENHFFVSLQQPPRLREVGTQQGLSLAVNVDGPDMDYIRDDIKQSPLELAQIMDNLPKEAVQLGPLSEDELIKIKAWIQDPELRLCFKAGYEEPVIRERGFPAPWNKQEKLFELISLLETRGILERVPLNSGKGYSPGFAVKKSEDRIRLVVRFVSLNARLVLPKGCSYHDSIQFRKSLPSFGSYYIVIDVKDAFFRIPVSSEAQQYLHMSCWHPDGFREYRWKRAPQGLCCSPAFWAQLIDSTISALERYLDESTDPTFRELLQSCAIVVYADDVVIAGKDPNAVRLLGRLLRQTLMFNQMWVPSEKMQEGYDVEINGLKLENGRFFPKKELLEKVHNLRRPRDKNELRAALGLMNYVKWSSTVGRDTADVAPYQLLDLANSKGKFSWSDDCELAWKRYVENFSALPLHAFSCNPGVEEVSRYSLVIQSDASLCGIGYATFVIPKVPDPALLDLTKFSLGDYSEDSKLIAVGSRRLSSCETHYLAHDREGLGIHYALSENKFLIYLFGTVILQTDSKTALSRYAGSESWKDVIEAASTNRGRRWLGWINDLSDVLPLVLLAHVQGQHNSLADYLSRYSMEDLQLCHQSTQTEFALPPPTPYSGGMCQVLATSIGITANNAEILNQVDASMEINEEVETSSNQNEQFLSQSTEIQRALTDWSSDDSSLYIKRIKIQDIYRFLCGEQIPNVSGKILRKITEIAEKRFSVFDNGFGKILLYHNNLNSVAVVPDVKLNGFPLRTFLVRYVHEVSPLAAHRGGDSCKSILRRLVWFPRMDLAVDSWINTCIPCTVVKSNRVSGTFNSRKLQYVNQLIVCDWAGPLPKNSSGFRFCLFIVDAFSGFVYAQAFKHKTAHEAVEGILSYASLFGFPERFTSDNDPSFAGEVHSRFREVVHLDHEAVPSYSPATSGSAEAAVKRLKEALKIWSVDSDILDWTLLLKAIVFSANASPRYHSQISPFEIMLGRKPRDPLSNVLGVLPELISDDQHDSEYVNTLGEKLREIHAYWQSKVMESRQRAIDASTDDCVVKLMPGDHCIRVAYISGRRKILGQVEIVAPVHNSSSTFHVRVCSTNRMELAHGYQLIKLNQHPDRNYANSSPPISPDYDSYYLIGSVLEYCPSRGYFVDWVGYPASERSWQRTHDMPHDPVIREQMKAARKRFHGHR